MSKVNAFTGNRLLENMKSDWLRFCQAQPIRVTFDFLIEQSVILLMRGVLDAAVKQALSQYRISIVSCWSDEINWVLAVLCVMR